MSLSGRAGGLRHPISDAPGPGVAIEIAPGILWARLPLPFQLDHVNVYAIDDGDGWAIVDTGIGDQPTKDAWDALLAGPLAGKPITRLIVTHMHPDHVGAAGWLARRLSVPLEMTRSEYLAAALLLADPDGAAGEPHRGFYLRNGLDDAMADRMLTRGHDYLRMLTDLPRSFRSIASGDRIAIGGRQFEALTAGGHSSEQLVLHLPTEKIFLSADQVLARISPNISVQARNPHADPLKTFLTSLQTLGRVVDPDALVLPGHDLPFLGLHARIDEITDHHAQRCDLIVEGCRATPRSAAELVGLVFHRPMDAHQSGFAFGEVMAHMNHLIAAGRLAAIGESDGLRRVTAV